MRDDDDWKVLEVDDVDAMPALPLPLSQVGRRPQPAFIGTKAAGVILDGIALPCEAELVAVLTGPAVGATTREAFDHKERECARLCARLSCEQARALVRRLDLGRAGDALAAAFARLTTERRARLRRFLVEAPRRQALARARS